ncbi:hypothetical protein Cob_v005984 [Colletotrichum orbiculare MAFF 240422]|uniref:Protein NO VEIN C-terminal domain-containing protein n=1 Tax=Colletotrichum orbiculare (strain 104-T / ATCC 96160 / CBS 514.97 / LARS 414 / MAFF 240422) TaxID=1213857 RepID=A0A484FT48_COLOR|nr:hypothetical protein Cob_v005984 [Colletotrichum orbiculare MAFF 240422]
MLHLAAAHRSYLYLSKKASQITEEQCHVVRQLQLIYYPGRGWVSPAACVWSSHTNLQTTGKLRMENAGVNEIVQELKHKSQVEQPEADVLKQLILMLSSHAASREGEISGEDIQKRLKDLPIFPVCSITAGPDVALKSLKDMWYIADESKLKDSFGGKIEMLDLDLDEFKEALPLIHLLGIGDRLLSRVVKVATKPVGVLTLRSDWSNLLQMRAKFISVLGKNSSADRGRKLPQLRVYQATELQSVRMVGSVCDEPQPIAIEIKKTNNTVEICVLRDPFKDYERHVDDELENLFIQLCAITDPSRSKLVRHFLKESPAEFRTLLEEFGIKCSWIDEIGIVPAEVTDGGLSTASTSSIVPPVSSPALMENTDTLCTARLATDEHADITAVAVDHSPGTSSIVFDRPKETAALVDGDFFKKIGFQGEALVNESLKEKIPDWDGNRHWTSHLRAEHGLSDFLDDESITADFTYTDEAGYMGRWLEGILEGGPAEAKACVGKITYHIEVKGTIHGKYERFHLSQGQMNMASKWTLRDGKTPTDVFLIVRVYNLANPRAAQTSSEKAKYVIYVDPWNMIFQGRLKMRASSDDGYVISASDYALDHRGY